MTVPRLIEGDMREVLAVLPPDSVDAVVTDPPYHLISIVRRFGAPGAAAEQKGSDGAFARATRGFLGKTWDGGDIALRPTTWAAVLRVLKPGGHMVAFGGTRTWHRQACAIEDAGFEIRDTLAWLYGSGFPKSHDIGKALDKAAEAERWNGWGTALKPAHEPIVLARKPLGQDTIAGNVLRHGTGAVNIVGCRIAARDGTDKSQYDRNCSGRRGHIDNTNRPGNAGLDGLRGSVGSPLGRWPANVCHDGSQEVEEAFAAFGTRSSGQGAVHRSCVNRSAVFGAESRAPGAPMVSYGDSGSASRFFFSGKATAGDRAGSRHPTVKPVALMRWLVRLITPPGGTVLDPFAGSGTTGAAAMAEGFASILIEREAEYCADIRRRIAEGAPLFARAAED